MLTLGFFFLLWPGECAATSNPNASPFRLCDVHILRHQLHLDAMHCPEEDFLSITHVALEFTTQKNGVRGELVGLGRSGQPYLCPVHAAIARLRHMRLRNAHTTNPLYHVFGPTPTTVTITDLASHLHQTCSVLGSSIGIFPSNISVRSLRSSGAMALLCSDVDTDKIRLVGRWRSNEMLRYLHVQALPIVAPLATLMVHHGFFSLLPSHPFRG
jgi:hypothetical protein